MSLVDSLLFYEMKSIWGVINVAATMWPRTGFKLKSGIIDAWRNEYSWRFFNRGEINSKTNKLKEERVKEKEMTFDLWLYPIRANFSSQFQREYGESNWSTDEHQDNLNAADIDLWTVQQPRRMHRCVSYNRLWERTIAGTLPLSGRLIFYDQVRCV